VEMWMTEVVTNHEKYFVLLVHNLKKWHFNFGDIYGTAQKILW
jgi:hypothetical protein